MKKIFESGYDISKIKTGDVLLVSSYSWLAKQIQKFQKNKWNHAGTFIWVYDSLFVCESDKRGITLTKFSDYLESNKGLMHLELKVMADEKRISDIMLPECGKIPYDFVNLLFYQPIHFLTGKWIGGNAKNSDRRYICGEWCAYVLNLYNINYFQNWFMVAPVDLFNSDIFNKNIIKDNI